MTHRQEGPGRPRGVQRVGASSVALPPWWYDYATGEIVRASDGMRWDVRDVPELRRASRDRAHPVVDVDEVDRWVLAHRALD